MVGIVQNITLSYSYSIPENLSLVENIHQVWLLDLTDNFGVFTNSRVVAKIERAKLIYLAGTRPTPPTQSQKPGKDTYL